MPTTQQMRQAWSPACSAKSSVFLQAYRALDACLQAHNYRPRSGVTGAYNCRRITGGSGYSLHAYGPGARFIFWTGVAVTAALAVDINWDRNPYGKRLVTDMPRPMIDAVLRVRTVDGVQVFRWGGYYSGNKDAMHFEIVATPAQLARGIDWSTVPGPGLPQDGEEDDLANVPQKEWDQMKADVDSIRRAVLIGRSKDDPQYPEPIQLDDFVRQMFQDLEAQVGKVARRLSRVAEKVGADVDDPDGG